jgi:uncharacterized protein YfiM (DUF2279 family)
MVPNAIRIFFLFFSIFWLTSSGFAQKTPPEKIPNSKKTVSFSHFLPGCQGDRWIAEDKYRHFLASAFLASWGYTVFRYWKGEPRGHAMLVGAGFSFFLGLGKELHDKYAHAGCASWRDLTADILGLAFGILFYTETIRFQADFLKFP